MKRSSRLRRINLSILLIALLSLYIGSRYYPLVERIEIVGAAHHSPEKIAELANIAYEKPLLWITKRSVGALTKDPWIAGASVERVWPHTVRVSVRERVPVAYDSEHSYATDGTVLKSVTDAQKKNLIRLEGWGVARTQEALDLITLLQNPELKVISYTPAGFNLNFGNSTAFVPSVDALKTHWSSFASQQGTNTVAAVYPWGVSARYE